MEYNRFKVNERPDLYPGVLSFIGVGAAILLIIALNVNLIYLIIKGLNLLL
jgi:hypothetical protein